ncbi:MAG: hypothetical protein ACOC5T_02645 [Elusimicrobiota bacterium]
MNIDKEIKTLEEEINKIKSDTKTETIEDIPKTKTNNPNIKDASIVLTPSGIQHGIIVLWDDGFVTTLLGDNEGKGSEYTTQKPEGKKVFYMSQAWVASLGYKIKKIM